VPVLSFLTKAVHFFKSVFKDFLCVTKSFRTAVNDSSWSSSRALARVCKECIVLCNVSMAVCNLSRYTVTVSVVAAAVVVVVVVVAVSSLDGGGDCGRLVGAELLSLLLVGGKEDGTAEVFFISVDFEAVVEEVDAGGLFGCCFVVVVVVVWTFLLEGLRGSSFSFLFFLLLLL
jgi:uncharacterized membrane protein YbaN (DUF454 family)